VLKFKRKFRRLKVKYRGYVLEHAGFSRTFSECPVILSDLFLRAKTKHNASLSILCFYNIRLNCTLLDMTFDIYITGPFFCNWRSLKILGTGRLTWENFHFVDPKILCFTLRNSVTLPTRCPVFLDPWFKQLSKLSNTNRWHVFLIPTTDTCFSPLQYVN
jgi:hypothetical protein